MSSKRYKCPYCEVRAERSKLIDHVEKAHEDMIPEGYTATRIVYNMVNKTENGKCRVCGKPTAWNESSGRYNVLCGDPKCKQKMRDDYKKNMLRVRGTYNILNDPEQQTKMLANRSISGKYKFSDGGEVTYTGSYERKCLEFMDTVMQIPSTDIMAPGPTLYYKHNGEDHFYITDFYYPNYNLIIEVKDGGDNLNQKDSPSMRASREKTIEKEHLITDRGEYNYVRLTNNNFAQLIEVFMNIKQKLIEGIDAPTININESEFILSNVECMNEYAENLYGIMNTAPIIESAGMINTRSMHEDSHIEDNRSIIDSAFKSVCHIIKWCRMESFAFCNINLFAEPKVIANNEFVAGVITDTGSEDSIIKTLNDNNYFDNGKYEAFTDENHNIIIRITSINSSSVTEANVMNKKDIYYNKDKFDSGETNLCFITGHSGSGKSTMAHGMEGGKVEAYELDDLIFNFNFSDENLKEYGDLIYSFFKKRPGSMFRYHSKDELFEDPQWDGTTDYNGYECKITKTFIGYAMEYAARHKDTKFVIEGVWIFQFIEPYKLDNYAVYIKGTSALISKIRAARRDSGDAKNPFQRALSITRHLLSNVKVYGLDEKKIEEYRSHFKDLMPVNESASDEDKILHKMLKFNKELNKYEYIIPIEGETPIYFIKYDSYEKYYKYRTPEWFKKNHGGICWDYVQYEADWIDRNIPGLMYKTYFVTDHAERPTTHTFLLFFIKDHCYYFESSFKRGLGIFEFMNEDAALCYILSKFHFFKDDYTLVVYDPKDPELDGCTGGEFIPIVLKNGKEYTPYVGRGVVRTTREWRDLPPANTARHKFVMEQAALNITFDSAYTGVDEIMKSLPKEEHDFIITGRYENYHPKYRDVMRINGKPVAFIECSTFKKYKNYREVCIVCRPGYRHRGYPTALIARAISYAKLDESIHKLVWFADRRNKASIGLAKSNGFKPTPKNELIYPDYADEFAEFEYRLK